MRVYMSLYEFILSASPTPSQKAQLSKKSPNEIPGLSGNPDLIDYLSLIASLRNLPKEGNTGDQSLTWFQHRSPEAASLGLGHLN